MLRRAVCSLGLLASCAAELDPLELADQALDAVDPFIGSGGLGFAVGSVPPGPSHPFGLAKPGPDTSKDGGGAAGFAHCAGYWYEDDEIRAFSQLHLSGTGVPDYGVLGIMPVAELPSGPMSPDVYRARFDHRAEDARVGRYSVTLEPSKIRAELGATPRTALYRFEYPAGAGHLVIDLGHGLSSGATRDGSLSIDPAAREVSGWVHYAGDMSGHYGGFRLFWVMRLDRDLSAFETFVGARRAEGVRTATGAAAGAILSFAGPTLGVQIGLSFIDVETARAALSAEDVGFSIDRAEADARAAWKPFVGNVAIEGASDEERRIFYSALYRAHLMPTSLTEAGRYRGFDGEVHAAEGWSYYSDLSLWDTFRTLHPLMTLLQPTHQRDFSRSIIAMTVQGGMIPRWPLATGETWVMIGSHGESAIIDGWVKGVRDYDVDAMWSRVWPAVNGTSHFLGEERSSRECIRGWMERNYCAADTDGGRTVSRTLENAYNDWLLATLARDLGKSSESEALLARSHGWAKLADPETGYLRAKNADGSWVEDFDPATFLEHYTEGNARQWLPYVPHELPELDRALGGKLVAELTELFEGAASSEKTFLPDLYYWHGNEPDIHAAYAFSELGRPELTQRWVKWILDERYDATPAGLDGNDDGGTLSAWYVFSALGIYPKVGTTSYYLTAPRYERAVVVLGNGAKLVVETPSPGGTVTRATWNGDELPGLRIEHGQLLEGGTLRFE